MLWSVVTTEPIAEGEPIAESASVIAEGASVIAVTASSDYYQLL